MVPVALITIYFAGSGRDKLRLCDFKATNKSETLLAFDEYRMLWIIAHPPITVVFGIIFLTDTCIFNVFSKLTFDVG